MAFTKKFRENLLGLRNASEQEKLGYFLRAMPPDVLQFIRVHMGLNPPLEEVLHRLQSLASLQQTTGTISGSMVPSLIKKNSGNSHQSQSGSTHTNTQRSGGYGYGNSGYRGRNRGSYGGRGRGRGNGGRSGGDSHRLNAAESKSPRRQGRKCIGCGNPDHVLAQCPKWLEFMNSKKAAPRT